MKFIGFEIKYDCILGDPKYEESNDVSPFLNQEERGKIIQYLKLSDLILSKTLGLFDGDNYIGPYMIFSDGEWFWPNYFSYRLAKQDCINSNFLFHIREREYVSTPLTIDQRKKATYYLEKALLNIMK